MFQSPAVRLQNQENADAMMMARKHGGNNSNKLGARKAFQDRDVNCKTPSTVEKQPLRSKLNVFSDFKLSTEIKKPEPEPKYPEWLFDTCSYKDVLDTYEDILPRSERISKQHITKVLRAFSGNAPATPPPLEELRSPRFDEVDPMIFNIPSEPEKLVFNYLEVEEDIPVPRVTFSDFDF